MLDAHEVTRAFGTGAALFPGSGDAGLAERRHRQKNDEDAEQHQAGTDHEGLVIHRDVAKQRDPGGKALQPKREMRKEMTHQNATKLNGKAQPGSESLMMAGKTNVRPVDGPAVTDRDKR